LGSPTSSSATVHGMPTPQHTAARTFIIASPIAQTGVNASKQHAYFHQ
jgi:hypothetical protein